jgi:hypothetical protein
LQGAALIRRCCLGEINLIQKLFDDNMHHPLCSLAATLALFKTWNLTRLKYTVDQWNHWYEHRVKSKVCQWVPKQMHMDQKIVYEASTMLLDREWLLKGQWLCSGILPHLRKWDIVTLKAYNAVSFCL